ncbi:MAG: hypothetical protein D8M57_07365 [Candidatus Scalindua sp. AMX11]|nr:MAG: hypothetical protein DWQ00_05615 [Candidatus Scalindua sp.]NOG82476.1 hypothetical protein [Planctomycetota bacterium]RZV93909.1 MAG: hypothetical protein EX341_03375 [Candidatus Scalindua sp. SCAELEC01]TDE65530.1 MAG: hypothetical protein D8M57_07365 [Candidatus Scalindua sp. AMX11]
MNKTKNKKKIVSCCPALVARSQCPSLKRTRQIRRELLMLQRDVNATEEAIEKMRIRLRQKKNQGITIDCEGCPYNETKNVA